MWRLTAYSSTRAGKKLDKAAIACNDDGPNTYMWLRALSPRRLPPMALAIGAILVASALTLYFQFRALTAVRDQKTVILRQISVQAATDVATELRRTLSGPVRDTVSSFDPPQLRDVPLDVMARQFEAGLKNYPHVDRFFFWNTHTQAMAADQVLFYSRERPDASGHGLDNGAANGFFGEPNLGRQILALARKAAPTRKMYTASEDAGPDLPYNVFIRLVYSDAERSEAFAVFGFVVKPEMLRDPLLATLREKGLKKLFAPRNDNVSLTLRVIDEHGLVVHGPDALDPMSPKGSVTFPMVFYATVNEWQIANSIKPRPWAIEVSASEDEADLLGLLGYWPTVASVLLMLAALGITVRANRRALELTRLQAEFISNASHHLKTPLSLLRAATETVVMERVQSPEKLTQYLGIIRGEVTRMSVLVQRILEFSSLQQRRGYEFEPTDLVTLVRETVDAFDTSLSARQYTFVVEEDEPSLHVLADPAAIEQALVNLLDNAVKYSGGSRQVVVRVRAAAGEAIIEVVDGGVGIEPPDLKRVFDKFYRGRNASLKCEGFGLGLPIVREILSAHKGRVEVESEPSKGSTFRIVLPRMGRFDVAAHGATAPSAQRVAS